eukprot:CAMPEP_0180498850 /NCGR_PEP_ID=MMETSP1036_2-20121128/43559_1 /TAXON_ID=632150 /ORGANISM="Azadinium spinosum, Strain 3D9" /LENGTH=126 /DNA_ID=CAMNT_0022507519 /DNA_START=780 /DNA_END=1159 /DNA_ORIENTATION=-
MAFRQSSTGGKLLKGGGFVLPSPENIGAEIEAVLAAEVENEALALSKTLLQRFSNQTLLLLVQFLRPGTTGTGDHVEALTVVPCSLPLELIHVTASEAEDEDARGTWHWAATHAGLVDARAHRNLP